MQCMHYIRSHLIVYICNSVGMAMSACILFTYLYLICCVTRLNAARIILDNSYSRYCL